MHSMCIKLLFVSELFIIMHEATFKSGSYEQTSVDQTKEIEKDCGQQRMRS